MDNPEAEIAAFMAMLRKRPDEIVVTTAVLAVYLSATDEVLIMTHNITPSEAQRLVQEKIAQANANLN